METKLANLESVMVAPEKTLKNGSKRKAVFANWNGKALVKENGRIVARTAYGKIQGLKGANLATQHAEMVAHFNELGKARLAFESTEIAAGKRELTRLFIDPSNGKTIIETIPADGTIKAVQTLRDSGYNDAEISEILVAFKKG